MLLLFIDSEVFLIWERVKLNEMTKLHEDTFAQRQDCKGEKNHNKFQIKGQFCTATILDRGSFVHKEKK